MRLLTARSTVQPRLGEFFFSLPPFLAKQTISQLTDKQMKYLIVTGGVVSGLGKGISISSLGVLLQSRGIKVTSIKIDPYLVLAVLTWLPS